jgi:DNA-binding transcriptional LysR family regulator
VDLDLAQVRAFVAVVDHRHFGRAAQALSLSQQALSKRVARLEERVGRLLERGPGGVALTAAGERFLPGARQLLELADRAVADAREVPVAPLHIDVWGELHPPARLVRAAARDRPDVVVELSMRRDLARAIEALERHEVDLAFGNVAHLDPPLPRGMTAELVTTDPIAVMVNARGALAARDRLTPADLVRHGIWWPAAGSSAELLGFAGEYAREIGATLGTTGSNLGLEALIDRVAADSELLTPVAAAWPVPGGLDVRVVPLEPTPHYPWYAVWRADDRHPALPRVLRAVRALGTRPDPAAAIWLPRAVREHRPPRPVDTAARRW